MAYGGVSISRYTFPINCWAHFYLNIITVKFPFDPGVCAYANAYVFVFVFLLVKKQTSSMLNWHHQHKLYLKFFFPTFEEQANTISLENAHANILLYVGQRQAKPIQNLLSPPPVHHSSPMPHLMHEDREKIHLILWHSSMWIDCVCREIKWYASKFRVFIAINYFNVFVCWVCSPIFRRWGEGPEEQHFIW